MRGETRGGVLGFFESRSSIFGEWTPGPLPPCGLPDPPPPHGKQLSPACLPKCVYWSQGQLSRHVDLPRTSFNALFQIIRLRYLRLLLLIKMFPSQEPDVLLIVSMFWTPLCVPPAPYTIMDKAIINKDEMDDEGHSQILVNLCPVLVFPSQASLDRVSDFRISTVKCHSGRFITPSTFQPLSQFLLR